MKAFILYAEDQNIERTKELLIKEWSKDTTRLDILQDVAKIFYLQEDYDSAFHYYKKLVEARDRNSLDIYAHENIKVGVVYEKLGLNDRAAEFFQSFGEYCERDESIYQSASMAVKYAHEGETDQAIEQLKVFAEQGNYQYWIVLFLEMDPLIKSLKNHPEFDETIQKIKDRFWEDHQKLKQSLEEKGLI